MTTFVVHDPTGRAVSIGSTLADPLPAGLTAVAISDQDAVGLFDGSRQWDATTRAVVARVDASPPGPDERIAAAVTALTALDAIAAPVLAAEVLDVLDDLRTALGGA